MQPFSLHKSKIKYLKFWDIFNEISKSSIIVIVFLNMALSKRKKQ